MHRPEIKSVIKKITIGKRTAHYILLRFYEL